MYRVRFGPSDCEKATKICGQGVIEIATPRLPIKNTTSYNLLLRVRQRRTPIM